MPPKVNTSVITVEQLEKERDRIASQARWIEKLVSDHHGKIKLLTSLKIKEYLALVDQCYNKVQDVFEKLHAQAEPADIGQVNVDFEITMERFIDMKEDLIKIQKTLPPTTPPASSSSGNPARADVRLPKLEIPHFDGNLLEWSSFRDMFCSTIHVSKSLSNTEKLAYLLSFVEGDAARLIKSLPFVEASYDIAWRVLNDRYQNDKELVFAILRRFDNFPKLQTESLSGIRGLIDATQDCLRSLNALKYTHNNTSDAIILYHVLCKLDSESKKQWEHSHEGSDMPEVSELIEFLEKHARALTSMSTESRPKQKDNHGQAKQHIQKQKTFSQQVKEQPTCKVCSEINHPLYKCKIFLSKSPPERSDLVKRNSFCFNCLQPSHTSSQCESKSRCRKCNGKHHTLIHKEVESSSSAPPPETHTAGHTQEGRNPQSMLATAIVRVRDFSGMYQHCRAFLDGGSTASFISETCLQRLGLKKTWSSAEVVGLSSASVGTARGKTTLTLQPYFDTKPSFVINALVLPKLTGNLPEQLYEPTHWTHLDGLRLADPTFHKPATIDILLGSDVFWDLLKDGKRTGPKNSPSAINSALGWLVAGKTEGSTITVHSNFTRSLDESIQRFWEIESVPERRIPTSEEKACELHFLQTHRRDDKGRYHVQLPWKDFQHPLGSSKPIAMKRFKQLESRLCKSPQYYEDYRKFMAEYLSMGHMELITKNEVDNPINPTCFIPHHFVTKLNSSTTKFRVVFDASAKTANGFSLNDNMMVGPTLQDNLSDLIMRFRTHQIAFTADIAKMYRQIRVSPSDADKQRILWRPTIDEALLEYRLLTVTYGTAAAPFLATRTLQQLAIDEASSFPLAAFIILRDFYVDDLMSGCGTEQEAKQLYDQLVAMCKRGGMELRKWTSNSSALLNHIPVSMREKLSTPDDSLGGEPTVESTSTKLDSCIDMTSQFSSPLDQTVKCLGIAWNTTKDVFQFRVHFPHQDGMSYSKRIILSEISRLFDPLGWLSPIIIQAKIFMQQLWKLDVGWDEILPEHQQQKWIDFKSQLIKVESIVIPRCIVPSTYILLELAGYCDASESAYSAVVFLRVIIQDNLPIFSNVTSKTRVAPAKTVSLPRLELCGAHLLAELVSSVKSALKLSSTITKAWTDSTITLAWIKSDPSRLKTFVANRVTEIVHHIPASNWNHIPGIDNPADCASRGISPAELQKHQLWWNGPQMQNEYSENDFHQSLSAEESAVFEMEQKQVVTVATSQVNHDDAVGLLIKRYSTLRTLLRVTSFVKRIFHHHKPKCSDKGITPLTPEELESAMITLVRNIQQKSFLTEITHLQKGKPIPRGSQIVSLNPFLDSNGTLRVGGRLRHSELSDSQKFPMLLPRHSTLTDLVIRNIHHSNCHAGPTLLLSILQQRFWIVRGRDAVRFAINKCITCRRLSAKTLQQQMADLPKSRVIPAPAFNRSGVDFAGPFLLRPDLPRSKALIKAYMCIFICMVTKAVHLELVSSLSTDAFIAALKRFVSRRNRPAQIFSDCGTNFVGAARHLNEMASLLADPVNNNRIANQLSSEGIKWTFNPPGAPHFGGLWEAGVKSVKFHLTRVIGSARLTFEEMTTLLAQIEACLNSRPLSPISADPSDFTCLTPGHFLTGSPLNAVPETDVTTLNAGRLNRWQLVQQMQQQFWKRWSGEYLTRLQQRPKWLNKKTQPEVGDLVLIKDENIPPQKWKLARILALRPGADGLPRVAELKTSDSELIRPIVKLCLLPVSSTSSESEIDSL